MMGERARNAGFALTERLLDEVDNIRIFSVCGQGSFKSQMKKADKSQADIAVIIGDDELDNEMVSVKYLRSEANSDAPQQQKMTQQQLIDVLKTKVN